MNPRKAKTYSRRVKKSDIEKRIVADVPERLHLAVRTRCASRGIQVREYIIELLAKDGIE